MSERKICSFISKVRDIFEKICNGKGAAFDNILPSLFGALGVVYISKNWKISIVPLVFMITLFLLVPSLSGSVGVLVPVGALITIASARILYNKGKL